MGTRFKFTDASGITYEELHDIIRFSGTKSNYTDFYLTTSEAPIRQSQSIGHHYERVKSSGLFLLINRSDVINLIYVHRLEAFTVILTDGTELDITSHAHDELMKMIPSV